VIRRRKSVVPDKLINFMCYDEAEKMIGTTDVTLPNLAYMTDTIRGAGINGEIDAPTRGHFQSLSMTVNWRSLIPENLRFVAPRTYLLTYRGSLQIYNPDSGEFTSQAIKVVTKSLPKSLNPGNFDVATQMGTTGEFELVYIKITIEGWPLLEIDKLSFICKIDGVDYLAKVRQDIGLA